MIKVIVLLTLLAVLWWAVRSLEPKTLYYPDRTLIANPSVYRMAFEDVRLTTTDGKRIHGWFLPADRGQRNKTPPLTLLFSHGNAGNVSHRLDKLKIFHELGLNVLIYDYRGYGLSEGHPSEQGTYQDAEAAWRYLTETKSIPPGQIIPYGESLGCAVTVEIARRHGGAGMILESPFTSTLAMAKKIFPWLPAQWIVRYRYDNLSKIPFVHLPLLILHSPQDEVVPFEMGQELFAAAPEPKRFFELQGGHNDGFLQSGTGYAKAIEDFLKFIDTRTMIGSR